MQGKVVSVLFYCYEIYVDSKSFVFKCTCSYRRQQKLILKLITLLLLFVVDSTRVKILSWILSDDFIVFFITGNFPTGYFPWPWWMLINSHSKQSHQFWQTLTTIFALGMEERTSLVRFSTNFWQIRNRFRTIIRFNLCSALIARCDVDIFLWNIVRCLQQLARKCGWPRFPFVA